MHHHCNCEGPLAPRVAHKLFGDLATELGYYHFCHTYLEGIPVVLSRTGWVVSWVTRLF